MATGKFVLDKGRTGKFRFNLLSTNGRVVATSEAYDTKAAALKGVAAVQKLAAGARLVDNSVAAAPAKKATAKKATAKKAGAKKAVARKAAPRKVAAKRATKA
jgi:uncharacterized protein